MKILVLMAFLVGSPSFGGDDYGAARESFLNGSPERTQLTWDRVESVFSGKQQPQTVVEFLEWVAKAVPYQLKHFSLVHTSESLQESNPLEPRAIVFGPDARFIFTFNGGSQQKGYDRLEIIHFREKEKKFEFREIHFDPSGPKVSEANPAKCMQCHTPQLRPIWAPYELWKSAYGAFDDGIIDFENQKHPTTAEPEVKKIHGEALANFRKFKPAFTDHPRYRFLKPPSGSPVSPYSPKHRGNYRFRPNLALTDRLVDLQTSSLLRQLKENQDCYSTYKEFLATVLFNCGVDHLAKSAHYEKVLGIVKKQLDANYPGKRLVSWDGYNGSDWKQSSAVTLSLMGVERDEWSLKLRPQVWSYFEGGSYLSELMARKIYLELQDPELSDYSVIEKFNSSFATYDANGDNIEVENPLGMVCRRLVSLAEKKITRNPGACAHQERLPVVPKVVGLCQSCHLGNTEGPKIDFSSPRRGWIERIQQQLVSDTMPPENPINDRHKKMLLDYLNGHIQN